MQVNFNKYFNQSDRAGDRWIVLGLSIAALVLFTVNLGELPLRDWDEGLVAQVAREIWQAPAGSFTWLYPTLWGEPYFNKPTLVHSLVAWAYAVGGVNETMARLPSALLTTISVPLLYGIGRELFFQRLPALFAVLIYLTSLPVVRQGRLAMLDGAILCFLLLMVWCLLRARRNYRFASGFGLSFGLICLTKGIMVGVLLGAIALIFIAWDTPRLLRLPYLWLGLLLGTVPVALWYLAQWQHYGAEFWSQNLVNQSLQRIWAGVENNSGPPWYYLLEVLKYSAPWLLFLPLGIKQAWLNRNLSWAKLALVWAGVYFVAISLMTTKLPWYSLPLYPALALFGGVALAQLWQKGNWHGVRQLPAPVYSWLWLVWFSLLALAGWGGFIYFGWFSTLKEPDLALILAMVGMTMTIATLLVLRQNPQFIAVIIWGTYLALVLLMVSEHWVWELAEAYPVKPVAAVVQQAAKEQKVYTSYPYNRPSLNFYSDRQVVPASLQELRRRWRREDQPYLLLDQETLASLKLARVQTLGIAEGWTLITKGAAKPPLPPAPTTAP
ncbi:MAG: hypothetical protein Kow00121_40060 [Elainellaceae cyanobacterium]